MVKLDIFLYACVLGHFYEHFGNPQQEVSLSNRIKQTTLFLRSGYFIDNLKKQTKLTFEQLESRVRSNQYENRRRNDDPSLSAPAYETVRDYFRLYRSVAFEPNEKAEFAPWLLAAELEFKGSSFAFFHPIFDLLFGQIESSHHWSAHFHMIPKSWIADAKARGDTQIAQEWELMNESTLARKYRTKQSVQLDTLSFVHLSLLRLPDEIRDALFERESNYPEWSRKYSSPEVEIAHLQSISSMESLAALLALMMEKTEIGTAAILTIFKRALIKHMSFMDNDPACDRIKDELKTHIIMKCSEVSTRSYSSYLHFGFGLPVSWRAMEMEKYLRKSPFEPRE